jgi:phospholipid-translocating ATPase
MHNKSVLALISLVLSIGGWFLWNIILSSVYHKNKIYAVKHGFLSRFGRNPLWWFTLILILVSVLAFELAVIALRTAYWPTDTDIFQELEQDLEVRKRFEEASALELQQGWQRGEKKGSTELERQQEREDGVREILQNRPDHLAESEGKAKRISLSRRSTDVQEALSRRFGSVKSER